jgi:hypothetical protein
MLGRLLVFSRLLDANMVDDDAPRCMARTFLEGDYAPKCDANGLTRTAFPRAQE